MDYQDFELKIGIGDENKYPVSVSSSGGRASAIMHFPYDELELNNFQNSLSGSSGSGSSSLPGWGEPPMSVKAFGEGLFNALIVGDVRECYFTSRNIAKSKDSGLRIRLIIDAGAPELATVPWEFLRHKGIFLALDSFTPISRYIEAGIPPEPFAIAMPLRILGMIASPSELGALDIDTEKQKIDDSIKDLVAKGIVEMKWVDGQTWRDLKEFMHKTNGPWHIFHFIGHGGFNKSADEGFLALADDRGKKHELLASDLGYLLHNHASLRLVVINACSGAKGSDSAMFSSTSSILSRVGIPAVIAMQYKISDDAAIEFAYTFYDHLAKKLDPVDTSLTGARIAVKIKHNRAHEWGTPVLHLRAPDGRLFSIVPDKNISSFFINPVNSTLISGQQIQFKTYDAKDKELESPDFRWTSEDPDVLSVDTKSGRAIAKAPGKTKVTASLGDSEDYVEIVVNPHPSVTKITEDPADEILMEVTFDAELWERSGARNVKICLESASTSSGWWKGLGLRSQRPTIEGEAKDGIQWTVIPAGSVQLYYWKAKFGGKHKKVGKETIDMNNFGGCKVIFKWQKD